MPLSEKPATLVEVTEPLTLEGYLWLPEDTRAIKDLNLPWATIEVNDLPGDYA